MFVELSLNIGIKLRNLAISSVLQSQSMIPVDLHPEEENCEHRGQNNVMCYFMAPLYRQLCPSTLLSQLNSSVFHRTDRTAHEGHSNVI